jgi:hypothetical protein
MKAMDQSNAWLILSPKDVNGDSLAVQLNDSDVFAFTTKDGVAKQVDGVEAIIGLIRSWVLSSDVVASAFRHDDEVMSAIGAVRLKPNARVRDVERDSRGLVARVIERETEAVTARLKQ